MNLWILLAIDFIIQEPISSSALLLQAYLGHYNLWLIHILFIVATLFDIIVGFYVGKILYKYLQNHHVTKSVKSKVDLLNTSMGKYGKIISLVVFAPLIFPISAFLIPLFEVTLIEAIFYVLLGEILFWYLPEWLLVLSTKSIFDNSKYALYAIVAISALLTLGIKILIKRKTVPFGSVF